MGYLFYATQTAHIRKACGAVQGLGEGWAGTCRLGGVRISAKKVPIQGVQSGSAGEGIRVPALFEASADLTILNHRVASGCCMWP